MFNQDTQQFRSFGRRRGKSLSPKQKALLQDVFPALDISPKIAKAQNPISDIMGPIWLEIGFGGGEHLLWQAQQNPDINFIGVEPFLNGVAKTLRGIERLGLDNIRLYNGDVRDVLGLLPAGSLDRVFILFPDPWPKLRHHKRRLINMDLIENLHKVLCAGGILRFASDIDHYVDWSLTRLYRHGGFAWRAKSQQDWRERGADWPSTRYFEKALREGSSGNFFEFIRQ